MTPRQKIGIAVLIAVSLSGAWRLLDSALQLIRQQPAIDGVSQMEARWRPLRDALPRRGVIGYLSDIDPKDAASDQAEYLLAQYALAPVIVLRGEDQRFVIGNYRAAPDAQSLNALHLGIVRDFGGGVYLLRRTSE